jgi:DNA polymerase-3 subunit delta'
MNLEPPIKNNIIFGHDEAKQFFLSSFKSNRMHHAWLISGPKGIGKATLAFKFAKFLLQHPNYNPEDLDSFTSNPVLSKVEAGSHSDFMTISADTKDGEARKQLIIPVEEIREINRFLRLTPSESTYRVVVIDGAESMNINAANGILKILEEPPKNAVLFLTVNSTSKVLPTIRSRCISLKLRPLSSQDFCKALVKRLPQASSDEIAILYNISNSNLKLAADVYENYGISFIQELKQVIHSSSFGAILKFAEKIKSEQENWQLLKYLILKFIAEKISHSAQNNINIIENELDNFTKLQQRLNEAEIFHLDKQHVVLSTLGKT